MSFTDDRRLGASEVAQVLAELAGDRQAMPCETAEDLVRLLGHSLAASTPAQRRNARLGLLIQIVSAETGEVPTEAVYNATRDEQADQGSEWPSAQTLALAYGHWFAAVRAATRFWFDGGVGRVPSGLEHATGMRAGYQPAQITRALGRFFFLFGVWPTEWEYAQWRKLQVDAWRRAGQADQRLPSSKQIRAAFHDFAQAVAVAQAWVARSSQDDSAPASSLKAGAGTDGR